MSRSFTRKVRFGGFILFFPIRHPYHYLFSVYLSWRFLRQNFVDFTWYIKSRCICKNGYLGLFETSQEDLLIWCCFNFFDRISVTLFLKSIKSVWLFAFNIFQILTRAIFRFVSLPVLIHVKVKIFKKNITNV